MWEKDCLWNNEHTRASVDNSKRRVESSPGSPDAGACNSQSTRHESGGRVGAGVCEGLLEECGLDPPVLILAGSVARYVGLSRWAFARPAIHRRMMAVENDTVQALDGDRKCHGSGAWRL